MLWTSVQCLINVQENKKDTSHNGCSNEAYDTAHVPHTLAAPKSYLSLLEFHNLPLGNISDMSIVNTCSEIYCLYLCNTSVSPAYIACTLHHLTRDYPHSCTGVGMYCIILQLPLSPTDLLGLGETNTDLLASVPAPLSHPT